MMEVIFFYIFAVTAVVFAVAVLAAKNPVRSAFYLIVCLLQVAAVFVLLRSPFLAAVQVFIYVGAVMVLFLFAVLVLDIGRERLNERLHHQGAIAVVAVGALLATLGYFAFTGSPAKPTGIYDEAALAKNTEVIGRELFTKYIFPFEVVSLLLLIALVGAIVLVMRQTRKGGEL